MQSNRKQIELALIQLNDAIELFLDKQSYASATTLAGAAEEVFGKALEHADTENVLTWQWEMSEKIVKLFQEEQKNKKIFVDEQNRVRNSLKHYFEKDIKNLDIKDAAIKMIIRAQENASRLNLVVARVEEFEKWYYINIVG